MEEEPGFRTLQTNRWRGEARPRRDMKKKGQEVGSYEREGKDENSKEEGKRVEADLQKRKEKIRRNSAKNHKVGEEI